MPPLLMVIAVAFVVIMVMMGNNPMDKLRAEREKYGRDPLAREINKFNEKNESKAGGGVVQYKPPQGATVYRIPQDQVVPRANKYHDKDGLVRPAPDVPIEEWNNPYPPHMQSPRGNIDGVSPTIRRGTSLVPGTGNQ